MRKRKVLFFAGAVGCLAAGCGDSEEQLDSPENVKVWATTASALGVYANVYGPIAFADGEESFDDPACPATLDDGTTLTIEGGCVDSNGLNWSGLATIERTESGGRNLTLDDYGSYMGSEPTTVRGHAEIRELESDVHEFDVDLVHSGGMTTTFIYQGRVEGSYGVRTVWSGSGRVKRDGMAEPTGIVTATTAAQVVDDDVCAGQPASGTTTLKVGDQTAVVTYDGATDCDPEARARWSLDGKDRGTIDGIVCGVSAPGRPSRTEAFAFGALGLVVLALGRRRGSWPRRGSWRRRGL